MPSPEEMKKQEKQEQELKAMTETPTSIEIGGKAYPLNPLPFGKIKLLGDILLKFYAQIGAFTDPEVFKKPPDEIESFLLGHWQICVDLILFGVQIVLYPNKKVDMAELEGKKEERETLEWEFTTEHLKVVSRFIRESVDLGGLLKNVAPLRGR